LSELNSKGHYWFLLAHKREGPVQLINLFELGNAPNFHIVRDREQVINLEEKRRKSRIGLYYTITNVIYVLFSY